MDGYKVVYHSKLDKSNFLMLFLKTLRASSYEPGRPGWLSFRDFASPLFSFTKILMCSYEKAGWPGYRDLGFCDRDLSIRAGNFSHMNTPARIPGLTETKQF